MTFGSVPVRRLLQGAAGAAVGLTLGFFVTLAIFVAEARVGRYVYSLDDLTVWRWEALPTWIGLGLGALSGWFTPRLAGGGVLGGLAGAILIGAVGWWTGPLVWVGRSAPWAGLVLGAACGLLVGLPAATAVLARSPAASDPG